MIVLLASSEDAASVNIRSRLLEEAEWESAESLEGNEAYMRDGLLLLQKEGTHLYMENVDRQIADHINENGLGNPDGGSGYPLELLVFLSRHRSEKDIRSLTVHPPGNYQQADFGGAPKKLPPSAPFEMTAALLSLYKEKKKLGIQDQTTYEVTHHGPMLCSPSFFIEIGSNETRWGIEILGRAIARALLSDSFLRPKRDLPVAIGVGGGHYAPRFTDRAMREKFAFGHMIPDYILSGSTDLGELIRMARDNTPGSTHVFIHRSKYNREMVSGIEGMLSQLKLELANPE
ncbi:MAG: D-aminoacyl-tRNA deacylase [Thermoplasmatota archaeon]